jgi:hypothetical protein
LIRCAGALGHSSITPECLDLIELLRIALAVDRIGSVRPQLPAILEHERREVRLDTADMPSVAEEQRGAPRCSLLDSSCSADRRGCIHAQDISIRRKKVQTVEVYALGAGNRLVNIESAGEALSGPILRLDTVLVDHCK